MTRNFLFVRFIGPVPLYTVVTDKTKEEHPMKKNHRTYNTRTYRPEPVPYPNAADAQYFKAKALNILTAIVSGMGLVSAMLFLVTLA